jgi:signal transduction histidine kinase
MPSAETYTAFQDSRGFLWFGTDNGVARFDGNQMEIFHVKDGLIDPVVFGITEDSKGRLWFRTYSGKISYYDNGKIYPYKYNDVISSVSNNMLMSSLVCDSLDKIWFGAGPYMASIDRDGKLDTVRASEYTVRAREIEGTAVFSFYGPTNRINKFIFDDKTFPLNHSDTVYRYHVLCAKRWKEKLYVTNNNNVFEFDGKKIKRVLVAKGPIISLSTDRHDNLWLGLLNNGAERYSNGFSKPDLSLYPDKSITNVIEDHEGGIWLTTLENGALYIPNLDIVNFTPPNYDKIRAAHTSNGKVITGDTKGQLLIFNSGTKEIISSKKFDEPIVSLLQSRSGNLWISTTTRLNIYDPGGKLINTLPVSRQHLYEQEDGTVITFTGEITCQYNSSGEMIDKKVLRKIYRSFLKMNDKYILAGRSGLEMTNSDFKVLQRFPQFENMKISGLLVLTDSTFLAATIGNGLFIINSNTREYKQFNSQRGFIADNIYATLKVGNVLWFGTEKGLAKISLHDLAKQQINFDFLTTKTGLLQDKINYLAGDDKFVWVFSDHGITTVPTNLSRFAHKNPKFVLNSVTVNDSEISGSKALALKHYENNIQFDFRCITFNNPNILIRSRLSKSEPWVRSENLDLFYPSLAPNTYHLEIQYSHDNVHWMEATRPIQFSVDQPWYSKWYVQVFAFSMVVALSYLYFRYQRSIYKRTNHYLKIINEHQQKLIQSEIVTLERERNRISKELHDRVGTNLTAIKLTVNQILQAHKDPHIHEVEEQFQIAIREIKEIIYGLTPPSLERYGLFTSLRNYVGKLNKNIPISISLKTYGKEVGGSDLNIILFRVLQELLNNSIKHSFAKNITIHINSFDDVLNIVYEDDGIGFSYDPLQSGLGLDNIESRIHSLNGTLKFDSGKFGISYTIDIPITVNKEVV